MADADGAAALPSAPNVDQLAGVAAALRELGASESARRAVIAACRQLERRLGLRHGDVRERITGPLVDALHTPGLIQRKCLADGTVFEFSYRSKIARDFLLSPADPPDHFWEPQTTRLLLHLSRDAQHVIIGGGYIGEHAIPVARAIAAHGGVCHAFEPSGHSAALMRRNAALNGVTNLAVNELGLWRSSDARLVLVGDDALARAVASDKPVGLPTVTVDAYGRAAGIERLALLMLDIEGGEEAALEGADGFLGAAPGQAPAVVFEVHRSYCDWSDGLAQASVVRRMLDYGYTVFAVRDFQSSVPMQGCLIELVPLDAVYLEGPPHGFNLLALKDPVLDPAVFRLVRGKSPKLLLYKAPQLHHPSEWLEQLPAWLRDDEPG
jgi:FkbM family methyltransferase